MAVKFSRAECRVYLGTGGWRPLTEEEIKAGRLLSQSHGRYVHVRSPITIENDDSSVKIPVGSLVFVRSIEGNVAHCYDGNAIGEFDVPASALAL